MAHQSRRGWLAVLHHLLFGNSYVSVLSVPRDDENAGCAGKLSSSGAGDHGRVRSNVAHVIIPICMPLTAIDRVNYNVNILLVFLILHA